MLNGICSIVGKQLADFIREINVPVLVESNPMAVDLKGPILPVGSAMERDMLEVNRDDQQISVNQ